MDAPYTYVFVRKDLSVPQQIVQSSHAALEAGFRFTQPAQTSSIVLIGVENQTELLKAAEYLSGRGIDHELFYEPDISGYTAIATRALHGEERRPLKRFGLLR